MQPVCVLLKESNHKFVFVLLSFTVFFIHSIIHSFIII